jgi:nucleoside-diphosphate-sugar epimerase
VDLTNIEETRNCIRNEKPSVIVHAAAQRFPNKVDSDYAAAERLNVEVSRVLAEEASACDSRYSSPVSSINYRCADKKKLLIKEASCKPLDRS